LTHSDLLDLEQLKDANVIFAGVQTDMLSVYAALDVLAMPSLEEGLPMALLEAMASSVPVVATPVGQISEIVKDGETGLLVDPKDVDALVSSLVKMTEGKEEGIEMAQQAKKLVEEKHSSQAMAKKYLETYEWLAE